MASTNKKLTLEQRNDIKDYILQGCTNMKPGVGLFTNATTKFKVNRSTMYNIWKIMKKTNEDGVYKDVKSKQKGNLIPSEELDLERFLLIPPDERHTIRQLQDKYPNNSICTHGYETRMELMKAVIVGPPGTPYHDSLFFFDILFPSDYPDRPPTVTYWSYGYRLNPNLYNDGYVCLSLLNTWNGNGNEKWVPKESTLLQLLVSLEGLVLNEKPYFNEPAYASKDNNVMFAEESQKYNDTAFVFSLKTMSCLLMNPLRNFEDFISEHFRDRSRTILTSCQAYINGFLVVGQYRDGHTFLEKRVKVKESLKSSLEPCYKSLAKAFKKNDPSHGDILDQLNQSVETTNRDLYNGLPKATSSLVAKYL